MSEDIVKKLREKHWRGGGESNDECAIRRQKEREDGADLIEAQAKRIKELEYFMKWLASVQNGSFYVDDQEYQVTFTKTNGETK